MKIQNAKYDNDEQSVIKAIVDGKETWIPVNPNNRHYRFIVNSNINIGPFVPKPVKTKREKIDESSEVIQAIIKYLATDKGVTIAQIKSAIESEMV